MAKIVLVSKHINPTSWQLALALKAQQHKVILLTSYGENPTEPSNGIEIMAYFKSWSFVEGLKIIPGLFGLQPQILHVLLEEDRINPAQAVLSTFARSHPTCILTTSILNIKYGLSRKNPVRYLIEESDIITCPSVENLGMLRGLNISSHRQGRGILPPVIDLRNSGIPQASDTELLPFLEELTDKPFVVIPFNEQSFRSDNESFIRIRTLAEKYRVVLLGSYSHWSLRERKKFATWMQKYEVSDRWTVTGDVDKSFTHYLLQKSTALVLAGQVLTPVEMTNFYLQAIQSKVPLILDSKQSSLHAELWSHGTNCWILDHNHLMRDLIKILARPHLKLPETLSARLSEDRHLIDSSLNELNRLYNRALNHLR